MRLFKKILRIIAIILPCFLSIFISKNSFADSNPSVTFSAGVSVSNSVSWFPDCDAICFSQYSYLKITSPSAPIFDYYSAMRLYFIPVDVNLSALQIYLNISTETYYKLSDIPLKKISFAQNTTPSYSFTAELIASIGSPPPSGSLSITQNGTYDVTSYAEAVVNVPHEVIPGDYHDDLVSIRNVIIVSGSIILVIYFFYCIYGLILPTVGGKK